MISAQLKSHLESSFGKIKNIQPVSGGSINAAFRLSTSSNTFFLKANSAAAATEMFNAEIKGLQLLGKYDVIKIPKIILQDSFENISFLILEFIEEGIASNLFWEKFGIELAKLHQVTSSTFGLPYSNFIGSLPQSNKINIDWIDFFIEERILPQIEFTEQQGYPIKEHFQLFENLFKKLPSIFPNEKPALIHGDLWSGNFLKGENNTPILIDPSAHYGHREMDLAMSQLFGGFDKRFYESYNDVFPLQPNFKNRVGIYQMYYLMVHVNLFGMGYWNGVESILKKYS